MNMIKRILLGAVILLSVIVFSSYGQDSQDATPTPSTTKKYRESELQQLVAPIALFPDGLLAQVLGASTCPVDIVEAERWKEHNPELSEDDIKNELQNKQWDASVKAMLFFPQMLKKMNDNLDWTKELGDAFATQQKDVMTAIQTLRAKAKNAGNLQSDSNQNVVEDQNGNIQIQSSSPETVYVSNYVPESSYGVWNPGLWLYPDLIAAPAWPWGVYGGSWAVFYGPNWNHGWIAYNNNFFDNHYINPYKYGPNNLYAPGTERAWEPPSKRQGGVSHPVSVNQIKNELEHSPTSIAQPGAEKLGRRVGEENKGEIKQTPVVSKPIQHKFDPTKEAYDHAFRGIGDETIKNSFSRRGYESRSGGGFHGGFHGGRR